jgi:hypothetical protein
MDRANKSKWGTRFLVGIVFFFNIQCALAFVFAPGSFSPGFELRGEVGVWMVQALGILFFMWNVPYAIALIDPFKHITSVFEATLMQAIGLVGESILSASIFPDHAIIRATLLRFILFDGIGLFALGMAAWLSLRAKR